MYFFIFGTKNKFETKQFLVLNAFTKTYLVFKVELEKEYRKEKRERKDTRVREGGRNTNIFEKKQNKTKQKSVVYPL